MKKLLTLMTLVILNLLTIVSAKTLVIATDTSFVPFSFKDKAQGKYVGFDVDIIDAVMKEMKQEYELKPMDFNGIIPALQTGNIDVAIAGITITDERKKVVAFSDGYYKSGLLAMININNQKITSVDALKDKTVAVKTGTGSVDFAKNQLHIANLKSYPNIDTAFLELQVGRVDAVIHDAPNILYYVNTLGKDKAKILGDTMEAQQYGIAFKKDSELKTKVDQALATLKKNGTYNEIYKKWFGTEPK